MCSCSAPESLPPPAIIISGVPPVTESLKQQYEQYQKWQSAIFIDWLPDGKGMVVRRRAAETEQLFTVSAPDDSLHQLTHYKESVLFAYTCPDSSRNSLVFIKDHHGNERFQLFSLDLTTSVITQHTHDSAQNSGVVWSNKGDRFVYSSNRQDGKNFNIYSATSAQPKNDTLLLARDGAWGAVEWSPDDRRVLVQRYISRTDSRLYIFTPATAELQPLTDTTVTVSQELAVWGAEGRGVFFTSDEGTDFRCLRYTDIVSGQETICTDALKWDVRDISISSDRKVLVFTTNEHGFSQLYVMDTETLMYHKITGIPQAIIGSPTLNASGTSCAMTLYAPDQPADVYVLSLKTETIARWTHSDMGGLDPKKMVCPSIIHYPTFDTLDNGKRRTIPCIVYRPLERTSPLPVLITIHGGPESQFWPSFKPELQFLCNEYGIAIVAPNVRGSGGYGKQYLELDNGYRREDAVRDIGALLDWIALQPDFDTSHIAVRGGSYGGYMALASMVHYGEKLCAGIDYYGISNFVTFLENTSSYRRDLRRTEYGDERNPAMRRHLLAISPITNVKQINKPLLIVQGANDARVPLSESQQIADAVKQGDVPVWMVVADDEGHGFRKKANRDYTEWISALFLKEFLLSR